MPFYLLYSSRKQSGLDRVFTKYTKYFDFFKREIEFSNPILDFVDTMKKKYFL